MNQTGEDIKKELDGFELAKKLRQEAQALEEKERMKRRLQQLMEISEDPYYDQYLNQMMKDLESGKATAKQVAKEADRTYLLYQQRMKTNGAAGKKQQQAAGAVSGMQQMSAGGAVSGVQQMNAGGAVSGVQQMNAGSTFSGMQQMSAGGAVSGTQQMNTAGTVSGMQQPPVKQKDTVEFKIGAGIFSIVGAVFVLASFIIFGFNFLEGIWQGLCLYVAALAVILLSELLIRRLSRPFSLVITGIGISGLFISNVINYFVLKNINALVAAVITLLVALLSIVISRKKDAASIRLITILGCYICFLPIKGFESELSFLIMTGMVLVVNLVSIFLSNQTGRDVTGTIHIIAHTLFTGIVTGVIMSDRMDIIYVAFFIIASLVLLNLIYWQQREEVRPWVTAFFSISMGFMVIYLLAAVNDMHGVSASGLEVFYRVLMEIMAIAVAIIFYILWGKKEERWAQYYFIIGIVVLFAFSSDFDLELTIGILGSYALTKVLGMKEKKLAVLDCILTIITTLIGFSMSGAWQIPYVVVIALSIMLIRNTAIFHEVVITLFMVGIVITLPFIGNWCQAMAVGTLLILFLLMNHLPMLRKENQQAYNIFNVCLAGVLCLLTFLCNNYWINSVTMLIGAVMIIIVFRKRYHMEVAKKYFILVGFLIYMILVSHFKMPVIVSGLLMAVAIGCVGIGFWLKDKSYRICGLILAIFVCFYLIIFDFRESDSLMKALLFLLVGVIALLISFIYIYLEKKEDTLEKTASNEPIKMVENREPIKEQTIVPEKLPEVQQESVVAEEVPVEETVGLLTKDAIEEITEEKLPEEATGEIETEKLSEKIVEETAEENLPKEIIEETMAVESVEKPAEEIMTEEKTKEGLM